MDWIIDLLDNDALRLERLNRLLESLPVEHRHGLEPVKLLVLRPSSADTESAFLRSTTKPLKKPLLKPMKAAAANARW